jgi:two-component system response regulator VanR
MSETILIVDDEKEIADLVELYLRNENYHIEKAVDSETALDILEKKKIGLALLDVMLPDMDGFTLCKKIREKHLFPIIMLTAKNTDIDKINGLTLGADDYITKPFSPLELTARVKTQLRRFREYNSKESDVYDKNGLYVCNDTHICTLYDQPIALTPTEFKLLWYLCERQGKVVSSEQLFEDVWEEKYLDNNNTVMSHIARLREKLGEPPRKPKFIKTVWGVGYKID